MSTLIEQAATPEAVLEAARMWAAATTVRDGLAVPATAEEKLAGLRSALALPGASLHLATRGDATVGFIVLVPSESTVEVRYLGVSPDAWGQGVGATLLDHVRAHAQAVGVVAELWVLEDNARAIAMYVRAGWRGTGVRKCQVDTRRVEERFELAW